MRIICCVPLDGSCTARLGCNSIGYVDSCGMSTPMHAAAAAAQRWGLYKPLGLCPYKWGARTAWVATAATLCFDRWDATALGLQPLAGNRIPVVLWAS
jgi:hypothetical protein